MSSPEPRQKRRRVPLACSTCRQRKSRVSLTYGSWTNSRNQSRDSFILRGNSYTVYCYLFRVLFPPLTGSSPLDMKVLKSKGKKTCYSQISNFLSSNSAPVKGHALPAGNSKLSACIQQTDLQITLQEKRGITMLSHPSMDIALIGLDIFYRWRRGWPVWKRRSSSFGRHKAQSLRALLTATQQTVWPRSTNPIRYPNLER